MPQPLPPITASAPEVSIVTSAGKIPGSDTENWSGWSDGVSFRDDFCLPVGMWPRCAPDEADDKTFGDNNQVAEFPDFQPFTIYAGFSCVGKLDYREARQSALDALKAKTPYAVGRELWTGAISGSMSLQAAAEDIGGTGVPADVAAQALLSNFEDCSLTNAGVLHVPSVLTRDLVKAGVVTRVGNRLLWTATGNTVIPGPGYPNQPGEWGPNTADPEDDPVYAEADDGQAWMYVSGPVELAFGDQWEEGSGEFPGTPSYARMNKTQMLAERDAIFRFPPCCVLGALVDISATV